MIQTKTYETQIGTEKNWGVFNFATKDKHEERIIRKFLKTSDSKSKHKVLSTPVLPVIGKSQQL